MIRLANLINGKLEAPVSGNYLPNVEPATGLIYSEIPDSNEDDIELAVQAAKAAFPKWSKTPIPERHKILERLAGLIEKNLARLAAAESLDNGKPVKLALHVDIPRAVSNIRFYASAIMNWNSHSH